MVDFHSLFKVKLPRNYSEQTHASPYAIVRYPHQKRLGAAVREIQTRRPARVLDYGAGDGQVIVETFSRAHRPEHFVAYEPAKYFQDQLNDKLQASGLSDAVEVVTERSALDQMTFDFVACLGVLEHMPQNERNSFYSLCDKVLSKNGVILVDVPVEVGPTLFIKNLARITLKGRVKEYSWRRLVKLSFGAVAFDAARFDPTNQSTWIHDHVGFDYRLLMREIEYHFELTGVVTTPFRWLPAPMGNQEVLLTAVRKAA